MSTTKHTFRVEDVHCGSCALLVDDALEDLPGVHSSQTSAKKGLSTVELDAGATDPDDVIGVIEELGCRAASAWASGRRSGTARRSDGTPCRRP